VRSERAATVARWFDLSAHAAAAAPPPAPGPGRLLLVTGPSGAGKSSLLRAMRAAAVAAGGVRWVDVADVPVDDAVPVVDGFGDAALPAVLALLARVGLGEAHTYLRTPPELSDGQRWRLRLAHALAAAAAAQHPAGDGAPGPAPRPVLACDEFAAVLDRVTAAVVAHALRRVVRASGEIAVVVATSHDDLVAALEPDEVVRCDFGG